jgi:hypothetical protein
MQDLLDTIKRPNLLDPVAHTCNPRYMGEVEIGRIVVWGQPRQKLSIPHFNPEVRHGAIFLSSQQHRRQ